jgi:hypothetical protein
MADIGFVVTWSNPRSRHFRETRSRGQLGLRPGEMFSFGISGRSGVFQPGASRSVGAFEAAADHLLISNFTATTTYAVENLEGGSELIKVGPRRLKMVIPFEMSRVLIPFRRGLIELAVFGAPPPLLEKEQATEAPECSMTLLDKTSKYFLVLVALCEPRLRGSSMAAVPSVQEVVERLRGMDQFRNANRSSINYHIDYLEERKLPVVQWAKYTDHGRMHSKREALVAFALRFDLVTEEHLVLLPQLPRGKSFSPTQLVS